MFTKFLNTPININNKIQADCIQFQKYETTQSIKKSEVCINSCQFINCKNSGSYARGGAIRFECINSSLTVHATTFDDCTSVSCGGAIFACGEEEYSFDSNSYMMTHKNMDTFNSHYCCYSGCSAQIYDKSDHSSMRYSGYGSAILVASDNIELNYSSSIECPKIDSEYAYGAQFDIKTKEVKSCFINATKGNSMCCAAIEYRNAKSGFFSYQTIIDQVGAFITSFSSLEGPVMISTCNLVNNTLRYISMVDLCSLIYVMYKDVIISDFVVLKSNIDNSVDQNGKKAHFASSNNHDITVTVQNCKIDQSMAKSEYFTDIVTSNIIFEERPNTHSIQLLKLGDCVGVVEPPPIFETSHFTQSLYFTKTADFSKSEKFTFSEKFSQSGGFSETQKFTSSNDFTLTKKFTTSKPFSESYKFTPSNKFISTKKFTMSKPFSESQKFTTSNKFSSTDKFTASKPFSSSQKFTPSNKFTLTSKFTTSKPFSGSQKFTSSNKFTLSSKFTLSKPFSGSQKFTSSNEYTLIDEITSSKPFSESHKFTSSNEFTSSSKFSSSKLTSDTKEFSSSHYFTKTRKFSKSSSFSPSLKFSPSSVFSMSSHFTKSSQFSQSSLLKTKMSSKFFSATSKFSESLIFNYSLIFTHSDFFTLGTGTGDSTTKEKVSKATLIGGIVGGTAGAAAVACGVTYFVKWKKLNNITLSFPELSNASSSEVVIQNPLYKANIEDDPFQNDFAEHIASLDAVL